MDKKLNIGLLRLGIIILGIIMQVIFFGFLVYAMKTYVVYLYTFFRMFGLVKVIHMNNVDGRSPYTKFWTMIILVIPVFGEFLFMLWGRTEKPGIRSQKVLNKLANNINLDAIGIGIDDIEINEDRFHSNNQKKLHKYLLGEGFPIYKNTKGIYISNGRQYFDMLMEDLKKARTFIFLEYHVIEEGEIWERLLSVLKKKAAEGVEIKVIYDDLGSLSVRYKTMEKLLPLGIEVISFNRIRNVTSSLYANYRNHQRIVVIDGYIGYTGGINVTDRYGEIIHNELIKDNAIRMEGDGVYSMTYFFLQMWYLEHNANMNILKYSYRSNVKKEDSVYYQPFADGPLNNPNNPVESIYHQIIANANDYIYITSPFLNMDAYMCDFLCTAAKSGVDVRVIIPTQYDKKYWEIVTNSNVKELIKAGVKVYKYLLGYIHSKTIIADDELAILGTINLNYRSFYLHFENGVFISDEELIVDIKKDIEDILNESVQVREADLERKSKKERIYEGLLKTISPLL